MKFASVGLFILAFFACVGNLHAQGGFVSPLERALARQTFKRSTIHFISKTNNQLLREQLSAFFQPPRLPAPLAQTYLPPSDKPITFRVQETMYSPNTASAFAIEVDGHLFGVTAGHVMRNISRNPYMYFQTREGTFTAEKITSWRLTSASGSDVAVFEIPAAAREYVQVLSPAAQRVHPQEMASIAGFALNKPLWLASEEILFVNSHRLFLRSSYQNYIDGLCGSPVMVNGKVVGLYVGGYPHGVPSVFGWPRLLQTVSTQDLPPLHMASPIESIFPLVDDLLGKNEQPAGTVLKVLDMPIAILQPFDDLYSINVIRNGEFVQTILAGDLTDPEHLEHFLDLEENDIVRVTIFHSKPQPHKSSISHYGINVSTKQINKM